MGRHDDEYGDDGCGAQKRLADIRAYIRDRGDDVCSVATSLGIEIDDKTHDMIVGNAAKLLREGYDSSGSELRAAVAKTAGPDSVTKLAGEHNEVTTAVNTVAGKTLDRAKLNHVFGAAYQVFGMDVGVFYDAVAAISESPEEAIKSLLPCCITI